MACPNAVIKRASDIEATELQWLWPGRVPANKLIVLMGDPGKSKSTLTAEMAAIVSSGRNWPTGEPCESASVLIASAEDDWADTIRPRLDVAGADTEKVLAFLGMPRDRGDGTRYMDLSRDLDAVEELIRREGVRLMIMDPLSAYMPSTDSFKESEVRQVLAPLGDLAQKSNCAVVVVMHMNKRAEVANALYRGIGSIGFLAAARMVHVVVEDDRDEDLRQFMPVKANVGGKVPALKYRVVDAAHPLGFTVGRIQWEGISDVSAKEYFEGAADPEYRTRLREAELWLKALMEVQEELPEKMVREQAKAAEISQSYLPKAKVNLGIKSERRGNMWWWVWEPPDEPSKQASNQDMRGREEG